MQESRFHRMEVDLPVADVWFITNDSPTLSLSNPMYGTRNARELLPLHGNCIAHGGGMALHQFLSYFIYIQSNVRYKECERVASVIRKLSRGWQMYGSSPSIVLPYVYPIQYMVQGMRESCFRHKKAGLRVEEVWFITNYCLTLSISNPMYGTRNAREVLPS